MYKQDNMKLSEVKNVLDHLESLVFTLPNGDKVPAHFHVTEIGKISKNFIDCGGTVRHEDVISFQLWSADDVNHRLQAKKLKEIIELSEKELFLRDAEIEVEYQGNTIEKYSLGFDGQVFQLLPKQTDCLAKDKCGLPTEKTKMKLSDLNECTPGSGCC